METTPVSASLVFAPTAGNPSLSGDVHPVGACAFTVHAPRIVRDTEKDTTVVQYELRFSSGRKARRYSLWFTWVGLRDMHEALSKAWKKKKQSTALPSFPGRAWFKSEEDKEFMESRRVEIQKYLDELIPLLTINDDEWTAFLAPAEMQQPTPSFVAPLLSTYNLTMIPVSCLLGPTEELFIGPVVDSVLDALKNMNRIKYFSD
jgi:hypothetical protein